MKQLLKQSLNQPLNQSWKQPWKLYRLQRCILTLFLCSLLMTVSPSTAWAADKPVHPASTGSPCNTVNLPMPWETSPEFQMAISKAGTHIRMASFTATLHDPLPGELFNVGHAAKLLSGTVIQPGEVFSQNQTLGPYTLGKGYQKGPTYSGNRVITTVGGGVCKIASAAYNVVRLSNLQVVQRHNHSLTVPYVPPGQDATVYYGSRDFRFRNNTAGPVLLWARTYGNTLYMALYGQQVPPRVTWQHQVLKELKTHTIYQYKPGLAPGTEVVAAPGQDGIIVRSWITVEHFNGKVEKKDLGRNYYAPSPRIIEKGPRQ